MAWLRRGRAVFFNHAMADFAGLTPEDLLERCAMGREPPVTCTTAGFLRLGPLSPLSLSLTAQSVRLTLSARLSSGGSV